MWEFYLLNLTNYFGQFYLGGGFNITFTEAVFVPTKENCINDIEDCLNKIKIEIKKLHLK